MIQYRSLHIPSIVFLSLAANLVAANLFAANPNSSDPKLGIEVHGAASVELQKICETNYATITESLLNFGEQVQAKQAGRISAGKLGEVNLQLFALERAAEKLTFLGETAGVDFSLRAQKQRAFFNRVLQRYEADPAAAKAITQARKAAAKQQPARTKQIATIAKLVADQNWQRAETELIQSLDQFRKLAPAVGGTKTGIYQQYKDVRGQVEGAARNIRREAGRAALAKRAAEEAADFSQLTRQVNDWAAKLRTTAAVEIEGTARSGPECLTQALAKWEAAQSITAHHLALTWLAQEGTGSGSSYADSDSLDDATRKIMDDYEATAAQMETALVAIILADATRATQGDVSGLYVAYLKALPPVVARGSSQLEAACNSALDKLLQKATGVGIQADTYAAATTDLLRWRNRVATARGAAAQKGYANAATQFRQVATETDDRAGFYRRNDRQPARLNASVSEVLPSVASQLVDAKIQSTDFWALGENRPLINLFQPDCYATATRLDTTEALQQLESDLQVDEANPPLTLQAAIAIHGAEQGRFERLGGKVSAVTVESLTTRLITLPTTTGVLFRLGDLRMVSRTGLASHLVLRYDLSSEWGQNQYFFVTE
jgi:hypothetical protein